MDPYQRQRVCILIPYKDDTDKPLLTDVEEQRKPLGIVKVKRSTAVEKEQQKISKTFFKVKMLYSKRNNSLNLQLESISKSKSSRKLIGFCYSSQRYAIVSLMARESKGTQWVIGSIPLCQQKDTMAHKRTYMYLYEPLTSSVTQKTPTIED